MRLAASVSVRKLVWLGIRRSVRGLSLSATRAKSIHLLGLRRILFFFFFIASILSGFCFQSRS